MTKKAIALKHPTYVVEYIPVNDKLMFMNRNILIKGQQQLGAVKFIVACRNIENDQFVLAHSDQDWRLLHLIGIYSTISELKVSADDKYRGLMDRWITTGFKDISEDKVDDKKALKQNDVFCADLAFIGALQNN